MPHDAHTAFLAVLTWLGGVASWLVAFLFDYLPKYFQNRKLVREQREAAAKSPDYAKLIGDPEKYVASTFNKTRPPFWNMAFEHSVQPLLLLSAFVIPVFAFQSHPTGIIMASILLFFVFILVYAHENGGKDEWIASQLYRGVIIAFWIAYLLLILHLSSVKPESAGSLRPDLPEKPRMAEPSTRPPLSINPAQTSRYQTTPTTKAKSEQRQPQ